MAAQAHAMAQPAGRGIARLILDRRRHPDLTVAVLDTLQRPRLAAITDALHRATMRAEISPSVVCELIVCDRTSTGRAAPTAT